MPIDYRIDGENHLVIARAYGALTQAEVFDYQRHVFADPEIADYDEIVDTTDVVSVDNVDGEKLNELAELAASMDQSTRPTKFAIVAPDDLTFGLARMYEAYRGLRGGLDRNVSVFRSREEALAWLGRPGISLKQPAENRRL